MFKPPSSPDYARVSALRQQTWELLDDYRQRPRELQDLRIIDRLQDIANHLGAIEESLLAESAETDAVAVIHPVVDLHGGEDLPISAEAEILLALAEVSIPLAASRADEAERWLRVMREHGYVGRVLQDLGMPAGQLATPSHDSRVAGPAGVASVGRLRAEAGRLARERGAQEVSTIDVLFGVMARYGSIFDRALYASTGKSRSALLATLADNAVPQAA
jgi:hypothetical protein